MSCLPSSRCIMRSIRAASSSSCRAIEKSENIKKAMNKRRRALKIDIASGAVNHLTQFRKWCESHHLASSSPTCTKRPSNELISERKKVTFERQNHSINALAAEESMVLVHVNGDNIKKKVKESSFSTCDLHEPHRRRCSTLAVSLCFFHFVSLRKQLNFWKIHCKVAERAFPGFIFSLFVSTSSICRLKRTPSMCQHIKQLNIWLCSVEAGKSRLIC